MRVPIPGPRTREMTAKLTALELPSFEARRGSRQETSGEDHTPVLYAMAKGSNVLDVDGNRYVDLTAGFGSQILGHSNDALTAALATQNARLPLALGDVYASEEKLKLLEELAALFPEEGARVILGLSGADALTAAIKTAALARGPAILAFHGSYHGLSYAPLATCGLSESFRAPFATQLGNHVTFAPYPNSEATLTSALEAVDAWHAKHANRGAILVEPILGRGGCVVPPPSFLRDLRARCDASGTLLIADEVWTGMGRSGEMSVAIADGIVPDILCLGKGLGGGTPISACIIRSSIAEAWGGSGGNFIHTATHFGCPPACAAALTVLDTLRDGTLLMRARLAGEGWRAELERISRPRVLKSISGRGLMVGIELDSSARALRIARKLLGRGYIVLTGGVSGNVLTLTPPLTIDEALLAQFTDELRALVMLEN